MAMTIIPTRQKCLARQYGSPLVYIFSIQLWILALLALGLVGAENTTVLSETELDQLLNVTCTDDADCRHLHFAALCRIKLINESDASNPVVAERQCACDTTQRFYRHNKTCVLHSQVLGSCDRKGVASICEDPNSECKLSSDGSGVPSCECKDGTILVEYNGTKKCAFELDNQDDEACEECLMNNGICFSTDGNKSRDGCACPPSFSGVNCAEENVRVNCSSRQMKICYKPHSDINVTESFYMATYGKIHVPSCRARRSAAECGDGQYLLALPLQEALLSVCGTEVIRYDGKIKYTSSILIQAHREPSLIADRLIHTFCSFTHLHDVSSVGVKVNSYSDTEVGQDIKPLLSLSVRNKLGEQLRGDTAYMVGDLVYLNFFLAEDNGYTALRVEGCTLSSSDALPDYNADTLRVLHDGCPAAGQSFLTLTNNFHRVQNQANELQTGLVQLMRLNTGLSLHIHCTLKLCIKGYDTGCELVDCESSKRRRRSMETEDDVTIVDIHGEIKLNENINHTVIMGMTLTSIALAIIVFIILVALFVVVFVQTRTMHKRKKALKKKRLKLVNSGRLFIKNTPSHMTESEV